MVQQIIQVTTKLMSQTSSMSLKLHAYQTSNIPQFKWLQVHVLLMGRHSHFIIDYWEQIANSKQVFPRQNYYLKGLQIIPWFLLLKLCYPAEHQKAISSCEIPNYRVSMTFDRNYHIFSFFLPLQDTFFH